MLDAWIGNTDRHHENYAWVAMWRVPETASFWHLAPTYDHASSLGRQETDENREKRLKTKDAGFSVQAYVEKARSAFYDKEDDRKPLTVSKAFSRVAKRHCAAARIWLDQLAAVSLAETREIFHRVPEERITQVGVDFAQEMLEISRARLLKLRETLS